MAKKAVAAKKATAKKPPVKKATAKKPAVKKAVKKPAVKQAPAKVEKKAPVKAAPKAAKKPAPPAKPPAPKKPTGPPLSPKALERLRIVLVEERERHVHQAEELQADADALMSEREQGDTQFDEESGEGDTISIERERDLILSARALQQVEEIDRALARMDEGTYGVCLNGPHRIKLERLEAVPWAELCIDCKQRTERRR